MQLVSLLIHWAEYTCLLCDIIFHLYANDFHSENYLRRRLRECGHIRDNPFNAH